MSQPFSPSKDGSPESLGPTTRLICLFFVLLLSALVFSPSLYNGFVNWDDQEYILNNPTIREITPASLKTIFSSFVVGNYQPLTVLSFAVDYQIGQLNPGQYHLGNILFHVLNVYLIFRLILLFTGGRFAVALLTALLFGIHPLKVESVAWATERKDVLFTFFYLLALLSYLGGQAKSWTRLKTLTLTGIFFVLSLLAKPAAFTLPFILVLFDLYQDKFSWKRIVEKVPFVLLSTMTMAIAIYGNATPYDSQFYQLETYTWVERFFLAAYALLLYLAKIFFPFELSAYYPYPERVAGLLPAIVWFAPLVLAGLFILINKQLAIKKDFWFACIFFVVTIAVNLPLLPVGQTIIADRFTYLPMLGLCYFFSLLLIKLDSKNFVVILIGLMALLSSLSWQRTLVWHDSWTLWTDVLTKYPKVASAAYNRGNYLAENGRIDLAIKDYTRAIESSPLFFSAYTNRGNMLFLSGKLEEALADYNRTIKLNPAKMEAYSNRAMYYIIKQNYTAALADLDKALSLQPQSAFLQERRQKLLEKMAETK